MLREAYAEGEPSNHEYIYKGNVLLTLYEKNVNIYR